MSEREGEKEIEAGGDRESAIDRVRGRVRLRESVGGRVVYNMTSKGGK
jgi:hypothetical protein